jgi:metal-responsive CopG/Arc/MetJ family transcriptional regulator
MTAGRHTTPRRVVSIPDDEWDDLGELVGKRNRSEVVRAMVRAFLARKGARMPRRSDYEPKP